jgi:hypothetical protein
MSTVVEHTSKQAKVDESSPRHRFLSVYHALRDEILADEMLSQRDAKEWMLRMLDHNVPGGKLNRGMAVKDTLLTVDPHASEALQLKADQIGWAIEFLQVRLHFPRLHVQNSSYVVPMRATLHTVRCRHAGLLFGRGRHHG